MKIAISSMSATSHGRLHAPELVEEYSIEFTVAHRSAVPRPAARPAHKERRRYRSEARMMRLSRLMPTIQKAHPETACPLP